MSFIGEADARFVYKLFKRYYLERRDEIYVPERLPEREFGYFTFMEKIMIRHMSFNNPGELKDALIDKTPLHVYHSAAFYKYPRAPMDQKGWLGSELAFDIDADHLKTPCKKKHDFKICKSCMLDYPVEAERCSKCGGPLEKVEWVCDKCLESAKAEALKLLEILEDDLGFEKIRTAFSGNRGYHLIVSDEQALELSQQERKEIIDYITSTGLDLRILGLGGRRIRAEMAPDIADPGWRGRIARSSLQLMLAADPERLYELTEDKKAYSIKEELEKARELLSDNVPWGALKPSTVRLLAEAAKEDAASHIDVVVTQDTHRLIRLGNSLNGKTGLKAQLIDPNDLDGFDPAWSSIALPMDEEIHVKVIRSQKLKMKDFELAPTANKIVKLPLAAAALLLCRGVATLP